MADYLQTLRMRNMFPGTDAGAPSNFPMADQYGMDMPSQGGYGGNVMQPDPSGGNGSNMFQPLQNDYMPQSTDNAYGVDEGYGVDFTGPMQGPETSDYNVDQRMNQLYDPQYEQAENLNTMLDTYPQRPPPKTGWGKVGAIAGEMVLGRGFYDEFMNGKHNRAVEDWKAQTGPTQQAAQIERQGNVNERQSAMGVISAELRNQAMVHKANNDETRSRIAQQRADAYDFKTRNPNLKLIMTKGGNVMAFNPITKETSDLGIPTGSLTQADHMALTQQNALERIQETGAQGRETEDLRQAGRIELEGVKETNRPPTVDKTLKPEAPNQTRIRETDAARKIRNTRPDLAKFLKFTTNGFTIMPSTEAGMIMGAKGPTPKERSEIEQIIYGTPGTDRRKPGDSRNANEPPAPPGYRYVRKPGGGWTAVAK